MERDPLTVKGSSREEVFRLEEECCCWREGALGGLFMRFTQIRIEWQENWELNGMGISIGFDSIE